MAEIIGVGCAPIRCAASIGATNKKTARTRRSPGRHRVRKSTNHLPICTEARPS
jgi:hypothetical protein